MGVRSEIQVRFNPSTPQHKRWGLPSARAQAEGSGLTLSGAFHATLKGGAWGRRMGQVLQPSSEEQESYRSGALSYFRDNSTEFSLFLREVGAGLPVDWNTEAFGFVRNGIVRAFEKMGAYIEVDDQL